MTVAVTPVNSWGGSLNIPADGEQANSASVLQYVQELANRLEYMRARVAGANNPAQNLRVYLPLNTGLAQATSATWALEVNAGTSGIQQARNTNFTGVPFVIPILPNVLTMFAQGLGGAGQMANSWLIKRFGVWFTGASGHSALPSTMPKVELASMGFDPNAGAGPTVLDTVTDTSGTTGVFQSAHLIEKNVNINSSGFVQLALRFFPENGANSLVGGMLTGAYIDLAGT